MPRHLISSALASRSTTIFRGKPLPYGPRSARSLAHARTQPPVSPHVHVRDPCPNPGAGLAPGICLAPAGSLALGRVEGWWGGGRGMGGRFDLWLCLAARLLLCLCALACARRSLALPVLRTAYGRGGVNRTSSRLQRISDKS